MRRPGGGLVPAIAALAIAFLRGGGPASAQPAGGPPPGAGDSDASRRADAAACFDRGRQKALEGAWAEALAEFLRSRELHPTWSATSSAAACLEQLGRYDEAFDMLELLLAEFSATMPPAAKAAADAAIAGLGKRVGAIAVDDAETGAEVWIDGRARGALPLDAPVRVVAGSRAVKVAKPWTLPWEARVEVGAGETVHVTPLLAALPNAGLLRVAERGGGALAVEVDGRAVGKTPWEGLVGAGPHVVVLRGEGNVGTQPSAAVVREHATTELSLEAVPLDASLRIDATPGDARIALDSVPIGQGRWEGRVLASKHRIEVSAPGYVTEARTLEATPGHQAILRVTLAPRGSPARGRRGVAISLGGGFLLSPSFGGDIAGGCDAGCRGGPGFGGLVRARGAYMWQNGFALGGSFGALTASQSIAGRATAIQPVGLAPSPGTANDTLELRGLLGGAFAELARGEPVRLHARLEVGACVGSVADVRTGTFSSTRGPSYSIGPARDAASVAFVTVDPELRADIYATDRLEITAGLEALVLIATTTPRWHATHRIFAASDGTATFPAQALVGPVLVAFVPGIAARYPF